MISAAAPTLGESAGHGPLLSQALDESMGKSVIDWLQKQVGMDLPSSGCLAGQSVMSALLALYGADPSRRGRVNDLDVFWSRTDGLVEAGWLDHSDEDSLWIRVADEAYDQIFARKIEVLSGSRIGKINLIQLVAPAKSTLRLTGPTAMDAIQRLDVLISDFDLSCVEVGVDLASGRMRWSQEFEECMKGSPVIATELAVPERTWLRHLKKQQEMPWLVFDQAQILSTVQFAQAFAYLRVPPGNEIDQRLLGWQLNHAEPLSLLDKQQLLKPLWDREMWPSLDSVNQRASRIQQMAWSMTPADRELLDLLISKDLPSHPSNVEGEPAITNAAFPKLGKLVISSGEGTFHGDVKPPDRAKLIVDRGTPEQLLSLFQSDHRSMRSRLPLDAPSPRHDLLEEAIDQYKAEFIPLLVAAGASFAAPGKQCETIFADALWMAKGLPDEDAILFADSLLSYAPDIGKTNGASLFMSVAHLLNDSDVLLRWWVDKGLPVNLADANGRRGADLLVGQKQEVIVARDAEGRPIREVKPAFSQTMLQVLGEEAVEAARRKHAFPMAVATGDVQGVRYSISTGAPLNEWNSRGVPPLIDACAQDNPQVLKLLLSQAVEVNCRDYSGATPLLVAARAGRVEHIELLLKAGADMDLACNEGKTPLHAAAEKHNSVVAKMLLRAGAAPLQVDRSEWTPLDIAASYADTELIGEYMGMFEPGRERTILMGQVRRVLDASEARSDHEKQEVRAFLLGLQAQAQFQNIRALGALNRAKQPA